MTGVERWTTEIVSRLAMLAPERYRVAAPPARLRRRAAAQAWEQLVLPVRAAHGRASLVFSPANLAPLAWPRNVVVVHDAAVLREPEAYSRLYRTWHAGAGLAAARRAVGILTVSEFSRRELAELAGIAADRIAIVPGGVAETFTPAADPIGDAAVAQRLGLTAPYVLTVATADRRKNLPALAPAAAALQARGIDLVWAGDARPYFAGAGAPAGLRRVGYVPEADLPALYRGALAFVLPSRHEGFGLTCLEAMACGTPVIAADRGALPETCGDAALLVDPDDGRALTTAVLAAATDAPVRERLQALGLRRARRYSWDRAAEQTDRLLAALAA